MLQIGLRLSTADFDELSDDERAVACLDQLGDGTDLYDFYYWQGGERAALLPWAANHVGAPQVADLCREANELFPQSVINAGTAESDTSAYLEDHDVDFGAIQEEFRRLNAAQQRIEAALARFARPHPEAFPEVRDGDMATPRAGDASEARM